MNYLIFWGYIVPAGIVLGLAVNNFRDLSKVIEQEASLNTSKGLFYAGFILTVLVAAFVPGLNILNIALDLRNKVQERRRAKAIQNLQRMADELSEEIQRLVDQHGTPGGPADMLMDTDQNDLEKSVKRRAEHGLM